MRHKTNSDSGKHSRINLPVALGFQFHRAVSIGFVALLLIIVFVVKNANAAQGCQDMQTSIQIIDESGGKRLNTIPTIAEPQHGITLATLVDSPFKKYATTISEHILVKIKEMPQCQGDLKGRPEAKLFFVYQPLVTPATAPFTLEREQSNDTHHLDSPWVKLTISRSPKLVVQAVFIWSERQFLLDQALMAGGRAAPNEPLLPIDEKIFGNFVQDYTDSVLLAPSSEARSSAQTSISKRCR